MTWVVVDASVAVKWFVPEPLSSEARQLLAPDYELAAPDLLCAEVGSVLWKRHRRGELEERTAHRLLRDFSRVPIEFHPAGRWAAVSLDLAIRHGMTVYDGLYLALASGLGCRLATADRRLHAACRAGAFRDIVTWIEEFAT